MTRSRQPSPSIGVVSAFCTSCGAYTSSASVPLTPAAPLSLLPTSTASPSVSSSSSSSSSSEVCPCEEGGELPLLVLLSALSVAVVGRKATAAGVATLLLFKFACVWIVE